DYSPFDNASQFRLCDYFYGRSDVKSKDAFDDFIHMLQSKGGEDGWRTSSVFIPLPKVGASYRSEDDAPKAEVRGVVHRQLLDLIKGVVTDRTARFSGQYHWVPHTRWWIPDTPEQRGSSCDNGANRASRPNSPMSASPHTSTADAPPTPSHSAHPPPAIRVITDCYNSNAMLEEDEKIRKMDRIEGDDPDLEYAILPLLLWSDETHLSNFGSAALWPIYLYFGHLSKYIRGWPTEFAAQHLAYIPQLPDYVKNAYTAAHNQNPSPDVLKFCKRELYQQVWDLLLDPEFREAYKNGIVLECGDGVRRRLFPRFFTYSADYPEKALIAALKPLANCLCPRCLVKKDEVCEAGTAADCDRRVAERRVDSTAVHSKIRRARKLVFQGRSLNSARVKELLEPQSLNPIRSAFSALLSQHGLDLYELLAPDLMHEFELGVWKNTFNHLMRILESLGNNVEAVNDFNNRYIIHGICFVSLVAKLTAVCGIGCAICRRLVAVGSAISNMMCPPRRSSPRGITRHSSSCVHASYQSG
ncbi:hypothetical protein C8T65DRAFT_587702, partial [Cerioporus squamosus]